MGGIGAPISSPKIRILPSAQDGRRARGQVYPYFRVYFGLLDQSPKKRGMLAGQIQPIRRLRQKREGHAFDEHAEPLQLDTRLVQDWSYSLPVVPCRGLLGRKGTLRTGKNPFILPMDQTRAKSGRSWLKGVSRMR